MSVATSFRKALSWETTRTVLGYDCKYVERKVMEGTSNMLDGSVMVSSDGKQTEDLYNSPSSRSRSGSQKSARANASLIRQPPEKVFVANCCLSWENPRPARILAARDSALSDSISASLPWMSPRVASRPSRRRSSFSASVAVSAIDARSASSSASCWVIF